ncbi:MAG: hypothetical protein ACRDTD_01600 [Pseudonocardiaceae bacterium]
MRAYATHPDETDRHPGELVLGMPRDTEHAVVELVTIVPIGPLPRRDQHTGLFEIRDKCLRLRSTPVGVPYDAFYCRLAARRPRQFRQQRNEELRWLLNVPRQWWHDSQTNSVRHTSHGQIRR